MKIYRIPEAIQKQLTTAINSIIEVHSIYCIGVQSKEIKSLCFFDGKENKSTNQYWEMTLLIVGKSHIPEPKDFMGQVFTKMNKKVREYSVHYTLNEINTRLNTGDNFLSRALNPNTRIFQEIPLFITGYSRHTIMFDRIKERWKFRINKAAYFCSKLDVSDDIRNEPAKLLLANQAISQTCAALLSIYWEYKPSHFDLNYLVHLCRNFSESTKIELPKHSFRSKRIYNLICHAQYNLNYKSLNDITLEDGYQATELAFRFLKKVRHEGEKRMVHLAKIHGAQD